MSESTVKSSNMHNLLWNKVEKQENVDFVFEIWDEKASVFEKFGVHSLILISKSDVFNAMITGGLKETSPVTLKDTTPTIFRKFIRWAYVLTF